MGCPCSQKATYLVCKNCTAINKFYRDKTDSPLDAAQKLGIKCKKCKGTDFKEEDANI